MIYNVQGKLLDACVLGVVKNGDTYGYDLTQNVGQVIDVSESALYPVLRRMLKEGLLESYNVPFDGRNRKYYKITDSGVNTLDFYRKEWKIYKEMIEKLVSRGESDE